MPVTTSSVESFAVEEYQDEFAASHDLDSCLLGMDLRYELENDTALASQLEKFVREKIESSDSLSADDTTRVCIALHESLLNAIFHGNLELSSDLRQEDESLYYDLAEARRLMWPYCDRKVQVLVSLSRERVKFVIRDEGPGFNVQNVNDPTDSENLSRVGGRGLLMIRSFMDEVSHNESGNCITLTKYSSRGHELFARLNEADDLTVSGGVLLFDYPNL